MAKISRIALFWKAFFISLIFGSGASALQSGELEAWNEAVEQNTPDGYFLYLSLFPAGEFVDEAVLALTKLGAIGGPPRALPGEALDNTRGKPGGEVVGGIYP